MLILFIIYLLIGFVLAVVNLRIQLEMREVEPVHYIVGFVSLVFLWLPIWLYSRIYNFFDSNG